LRRKSLLPRTGGGMELTAVLLWKGMASKESAQSGSIAARL